MACLYQWIFRERQNGATDLKDSNTPATCESDDYRSAGAFRCDDANANIDVCASLHLPSYSLR
jgi:hypothetical protein